MIVSEFTERGTKLFPFKITSMKDSKFSTVLYASSEDERGSWVRVLKSIISGKFFLLLIQFVFS